MAAKGVVWLLVWLCMDGVVAAPRDSAFLGTPASRNALQPVADPAVENDKQIQLITEALTDPGVLSRFLSDPNLAASERTEWGRVQKLLKIYKDHGISEQIAKLWEIPGVAENVVAISNKFTTDSQLSQFVDNATRALDKHDAAAEVLSLISFAPPPLWAWYSQAQWPTLGKRCSGSCAAPMDLPDNATLAKDCPANSACALECPAGTKQNPALSVRCACSDDKPQLAISPANTNLCIADDQEKAAPQRNCGEIDSLRRTAVAFCSNRYMCPMDFDEACCNALAALRDCDNTPFGTVWDNCDYKPTTASEYYKDKCGAIEGMCPAPEDLAVHHQKLDCTLSAQHMLFNGMQCTASCEEGYVNMNPHGVTFYACQRGVLAVAGLQCVEASCAPPASIGKGMAYKPLTSCSYRGLLLPGETCPVYCVDGLVPARGSDEQPAYVCSKGQMRPPKLECIEGNCEMPTVAPGNARYTSNCSVEAPLAKGASCQLPCPEGYEAAKGTNLTLSCSANLTLSVLGDRCTPKACQLPAALPSHYNLTSDDCVVGQEVPSGTKCSVACETGYEAVIFGEAKYSCNLGVLEAPQLQCREASCILPESLHHSMEFKAGDSRCIPHGTIASDQSCELECSEMYAARESVVLDVHCRKGKLDLGDSICEPNEHDPNTAACAHVQNGKCADDFIECEALSSHALTAYNTDMVCKCYDQFKACLGSESGCLEKAPNGTVANVLHNLCGTDCKQAYKTAFGLCGDQSGKCFVDDPKEPCCTAVDQAVAACPFTHNQTEIAMLYTSFKNYHCVNPLHNLPEFASKTCAAPTPPPPPPPPASAPPVVAARAVHAVSALERTSGPLVKPQPQTPAAGAVATEAPASKPPAPMAAAAVVPLAMAAEAKHADAPAPARMLAVTRLAPPPASAALQDTVANLGVSAQHGGIFGSSSQDAINRAIAASRQAMQDIAKSVSEAQAQQAQQAEGASAEGASAEGASTEGANAEGANAEGASANGTNTAATNPFMSASSINDIFALSKDLMNEAMASLKKAQAEAAKAQAEAANAEGAQAQGAEGANAAEGAGAEGAGTEGAGAEGAGAEGASAEVPKAQEEKKGVVTASLVLAGVLGGGVLLFLLHRAATSNDDGDDTDLVAELHLRGERTNEPNQPPQGDTQEAAEDKHKSNADSTEESDSGGDEDDENLFSIPGKQPRAQSNAGEDEGGDGDEGVDSKGAKVVGGSSHNGDE